MPCPLEGAGIWQGSQRAWARAGSCKLASWRKKEVEVEEYSIIICFAHYDFFLTRENMTQCIKYYYKRE